MKGRNMLHPMNISMFEMARYFPWLKMIEGDKYARIRKAEKIEEVQPLQNVGGSKKAKTGRSESYNSCQKEVILS